MAIRSTLCLLFAKSQIECQPTHDGRYVAPLIWQNTLGVKRANEICASSSRGVHQHRQAARLQPTHAQPVGVAEQVNAPVLPGYSALPGTGIEAGYVSIDDL